ncbi:hypothetical protein LCGC14_1837660 [marine sediment metagenome]|uniref:Uncharacterized protein n=1 Tax=marine sediment metagenome TaxID=412755 RepID=A0A0F9H2B4_9ZZZZ
MINKNQEILNRFVAVVFLDSALISLPNTYLAKLILDVVIGESSIGMVVIAFAILPTALNLLAFYVIVKSIVRKSVIFTKKGWKINVKAYMFIAGIANIMLSLITYGLGGSVLSGVVGITLIPWVISAGISLIAVFGYQKYTRKKFPFKNNLIINV